MPREQGINTVLNRASDLLLDARVSYGTDEMSEAVSWELFGTGTSKKSIVDVMTVAIGTFVANAK